MVVGVGGSRPPAAERELDDVLGIGVSDPRWGSVVKRGRSGRGIARSHPPVAGIEIVGDMCRMSVSVRFSRWGSKASRGGSGKGVAEELMVRDDGADIRSRIFWNRVFILSDKNLAFLGSKSI
jgi:hypothetical protein